METIIHFIIFLTAVIEIVLLVRFFALCNHVEEIKKKMVPNENFLFCSYCIARLGRKIRQKNCFSMK